MHTRQQEVHTKTCRGCIIDPAGNKYMQWAGHADTHWQEMPEKLSTEGQGPAGLDLCHASLYRAQDFGLAPRGIGNNGGMHVGLEAHKTCEIPHGEERNLDTLPFSTDLA